MTQKKHSRKILTIGAATLVIIALSFAFWPKPLLVDIDEVTQGKMSVTIDEEARTRVHDTYIVATPVAGRLMRVEVEPADRVEQGKTVIAQMMPVNPAALDIRSREQAQAALTSAKAALRMAQAQRNKAIADKELADADLERKRNLNKKDFVSNAAFEQAEREARAAHAALDNAEAEISMRKAEVANAEAQLIDFDDSDVPQNSKTQPQKAIAIKAPISGSILRVIQQSETTLPAGASIIEIGNVENDLEVLVELLSTDAVQIKKGDKVLIENWGKENPLSGLVERVDPWGFTKFSALGVEEQRVNAIIRFTDPPEQRTSLGHGFRVEVRIIVWEDENATIVPASALFRNGGEWAVFVVENNRADLRQIKVAQKNGIEASVTEGLKLGERVILYPSSGLENGSRVEAR